jgi:hypothetical protein
VIANRRRVVVQGVVGGNHDGAFIQVRLERPLEEIASVEQKYRSTVARTRSPEVVHVSFEQREAASALLAEDAAMEVVGSDNGQDYRFAWCDRARECDEDGETGESGESGSRVIW